MRRDGDVVSKTELLDEVWGHDFEGDPNIVEVYIGYLRKKIDAPFGAQTILTVRGAGYRASRIRRADARTTAPTTWRSGCVVPDASAVPSVVRRQVAAALVFGDRVRRRVDGPRAHSRDPPRKIARPTTASSRSRPRSSQIRAGARPVERHRRDAARRCSPGSIGPSGRVLDGSAFVPPGFDVADLVIAVGRTDGVTRRRRRAVHARVNSPQRAGRLVVVASPLDSANVRRTSSGTDSGSDRVPHRCWSARSPG